MDSLRNLCGSLTSGIVRLLVSVGILAAAYLLIVKPVLKTTSDTFREASKSFEESFGSGSSLGDIGRSIGDVDRQVEMRVRRAFHTAQRQGSPKKLVRCVEHANGDAHRIRRCTVKY